MSPRSEMDRRDFLKVSAVAGVGLVIGVYVPGCKSEPTATPETTSAPEPEPSATPRPEPTATDLPAPTDRLEPNVFVTIDTQGNVTITVPRSEMGQGVRTALPMILSEELEADWSTVRVEQAPADRTFGEQTTGGSASVSTRYMPLRRAGAVAREMLIAAAAQTWGVAPETCHAEAGAVVHEASGQRLNYGALVETAATLPVPRGSAAPLKDPADFRIIGTDAKRIDEPQMVDGSAIYGSDVAIPGMLFAVVARCPKVFGGQVASYDATAAEAVAGVRHVLEIDGSVAVVADSTWAALQGRDALAITWEESANADLSSAGILEALQSTLPEPGGVEKTADGITIALAYHIPYLAHATMEPMNCVADVRADRCEVWAPTQDPQQAKQRARSITRLPDDAITVHIPLIGGGFGRRLQTDYVEEAVKISQAIGAPVKVLWTREDDIQHDFYHPLSHNRVSAKLDTEGRFIALPTLRSLEGDRNVPTGPWRSVSNFTEAFANESFLDEAAAAGESDPLELRLDVLPPRAREVVALAAEKADWGTALPEGWGRGMAYHATFGVTHVAQVAEVSVGEDGSVLVHRVVCAVDCGRVINPDMVVAQMEGGIVFGLTAALKAAVTIENGQVQQSNFHDYPLLRMDEMPLVEVYIVPSDELPTGIGEMGVPPIAPAVANAVFAATGKRVRQIPIRAEDLQGA